MKWSSPQCVSAMAVLGSGVVLCYIAFFMSACMDVPEGTLWYFGQSLMYAGGMFGMKVYSDGRYKRLERSVRSKEGGGNAEES